ncbi:MAG TPA: transcriptional regulator, SARP family protein [Micromonosporaceae bacterium]|nr:transcriptional regulator, SARP family protein [Micromonosporaceae bacterium]
MAHTLASLLRTWRERALLTQEQLARQTGLGVRTIRRLESQGLLRPRTDSVRLLADALKLSHAERSLLVTTARGAQPGTPRQLPADLPNFTGRADLLRDMDKLLGDHRALVTCVLAGTAGVGKTALALHWAHRVADRFMDGQLYVNLRGFDPSGVPTEPGTAIRGFLDALGVQAERIPYEIGAQAALYRSLVAGKRMLVILDNARDEEQVRPLLPGASSCLALVTSRDQLTGLVAGVGALPVVVDLPSTVEARDLLARRLGADRAAAEPASIDEIVMLCARLPLALAVVAAHASTQADLPLTAIAAGLRVGSGRLSALHTSDAATDARRVFSWSYQRLGATAQTMFRLLGLHPGPDFTVAAAASLMGTGHDEAEPAMRELVRANLLTEHLPGRYTFHDLLRAYAVEQAPTEDAAIHRLLDHYLHTTQSAALLISATRKPIPLDPPRHGVTPERPAGDREAMAWLKAEHRVLLAIIEQAAGAGLHAHVWGLAQSLTTFFHRQGLWQDLATAQQTALEVAQRAGDVPRQAAAHRGLGSYAIRLGLHDMAQTHLTRALALCEELADDSGQAYVHQNLAWICDKQGDTRAALGHALAALQLQQRGGSAGGEANALNAVGWYRIRLGDYSRAVSDCQKALALQQELGNRSGQGGAWDSLGYAYHHIGDYAKAVECFYRACDLLRALGDRFGEADTLGRLGDTHQAGGNPHSAVAVWQSALEILEELGHPDAEKIRMKLGGCGEHFNG